MTNGIVYNNGRKFEFYLGVLTFNVICICIKVMCVYIYYESITTSLQLYFCVLYFASVAPQIY